LRCVSKSAKIDCFSAFDGRGSVSGAAYLVLQSRDRQETVDEDGSPQIG
jgi:hypothetical protein